MTGFLFRCFAPALLVALASLSACGDMRPPGETERTSADHARVLTDAVVLGFDHMPVGVADLEAAEDRFGALGFTLKPGRTHDNGIRNAHAKFADGAYIELITAPEARDALTESYRRHIAAGDGPAFLALFAPRIPHVAAALAPMGERIENEGYVSFRDGDALSTFFFGDRPRSPTDRPEHLVHANSAEALARVWIAPSNPVEVERMLALLGVATRSERRCLVECGMARVAELAQGELILLGVDGQQVGGRTIVGATIRVSSLDQVRNAIDAGGISVSEVSQSADGAGILVSPAVANGMWLEFREAAP